MGAGFVADVEVTVRTSIESREEALRVGWLETLGGCVIAAPNQRLHPTGLSRRPARLAGPVTGALG
jgi:hypothetical protein